MYFNVGTNYFSDIQRNQNLLPSSTPNPKPNLIKVVDILRLDLVFGQVHPVLLKPPLYLIDLSSCNAYDGDWFSCNRMKTGLVIPLLKPTKTRLLLLCLKTAYRVVHNTMSWLNRELKKGANEGVDSLFLSWREYAIKTTNLVSIRRLITT